MIQPRETRKTGSSLVGALVSGTRVGGSIPARNKEKFWCLSMLSLVLIAVKLNKYAILDQDVNWMSYVLGKSGTTFAG